jgi:hypothetical protein
MAKPNVGDANVVKTSPAWLIGRQVTPRSLL